MGGMIGSSHGSKGLVGFMVKYSGAVPGACKRHLNDIKRDSFIAAGEEWHDDSSAGHFTNAGAQKYGYAKRQGEQAGTSGGRFWNSYTGQKKKKFGHTRPLRWSGDSEDLARIRDVRATSTRKKTNCKIMCHAKALNFPAPGGGGSMLQMEYGVVIAAERQKMGGTIDRKMTYYFGGITDERTKKI